MTSQVAISLDTDHLTPLRVSLDRILSTKLAEITFAQIVDGIPIEQTDTRWLFGYDPNISGRQAPSDSALEEVVKWRSQFQVESLEIASDMVQGYQKTVKGTREFHLYLIGMIAVSLHTAASLLFTYTNNPPYKRPQPQSFDLFPIPGIPGFSDSQEMPPMSLPEDPTYLFHVDYTLHKQYPMGVADMVGYWAEYRVLGGVVLFDWKSQEIGDVYFHPSAGFRVFRLSEVQMEQFISFCLGDNSPSPFPMTAERQALRIYRDDTFDLHIFRAKYERNRPDETLTQQLQDVHSPASHLQAFSRFLGCRDCFPASQLATAQGNTRAPDRSRAERDNRGDDDSDEDAGFRLVTIRQAAEECALRKRREYLAMMLVVVSPGPLPAPRQPPSFNSPSETPSRLHWTTSFPSTDPISGQSKCCPVGTMFDGHACVLGIPSCPTDYDLRDGKCVATFDLLCPPGSSLQGEYCLSNDLPKCPEPAQWDGSACVVGAAFCPPGYEPKENTCISAELPRCPEPHTYYQGMCIDKKPPVCPGGMMLNDGHCASLEPPRCPPETKFNDLNHLCTSLTAPFCPPGSKMDQGDCISDMPPVCPKDSVYSAVQGLCISPVGLSCEEGYRLDPTTNNCTHEDQPACPAGLAFSYNQDLGSGRCCPAQMTWNGNTCVRKPGPDGCFEGRGARPRGLLSGPKCRPGFSVGDGICIHSERPRCGHDHQYDRERRLCVRNIKPECEDKRTVLQGNVCVHKTLGPTCPKDFALKDNLCISTTDSPDCVDGSYRKGHVCVASVAPGCPSDTFLVNNHCVSTHKPVCREGSMPDGKGSCMTSVKPECPDGQTVTTDGCLVGTPRCHGDTVYDRKDQVCVDRKDPDCPPGYHWTKDDNKCVSDTLADCQEGYTRRQNGQCESDKQPECPVPHTHWDRDRQKCVGDSPVCPPGQHFDGISACVLDLPPDCPQGFSLRDHKCFADKGPVCQPNTQFNKHSGVCEAMLEPECPPGSSFVQGRCALISGDCINFQFCPPLGALMPGMLVQSSP
ncbi:hypothetical protein ASPZODRAFT_16186 [Penicilliopsis zonata CBS 506.65]|uniref:Uncharacterized protein n=1 Tax=Penicilliopsis zonata CBS 506.65 TaxID=1073090 RepID=A0A1L9SGQ6_9EURO|nr:hypothetical protein ASPZODRAFT_16186 [Penicilliopsis zonata CBS 506.65]OJJ46420.1 hypothetical protein ASPZODRAFT_16186 [Penicilliopsis zonata CBS 506.65]